MSSRLASRHVSRRVILTATALALVGSLITASLLGSARAGTAATMHPMVTTSTKPSIVLVHGAWADSGSWDTVIARLQADGYTVYAPPNPLRGLPNDSGTIADFLSTIPGPIVLVGHSYGGAVITNAATGNPNVKALVYVDAFIPDEGDTLLDLVGPPSCVAVADLSTVFNFVPFPGAPTGAVDAYVKQDVFPGCFANGLSARRGAVLAATQRPLATNAFGEPSGPPAWEAIPSWAVVGTADLVIPKAQQLSMAENAGAHITKVDAPHLSMISNPGRVKTVIERAATG